MPSIFNILLASGAALAWAVMGLPIALRLLPRLWAFTAAPVLGWAIHNVLALPVLQLVGMSRTSVAGLAGIFLLAALATLTVLRVRHAVGSKEALFSAAALTGAALLAIVPTLALLPTVSPAGVAFAQPIFDHTKIAMVDEMVRNGVPPANPFFAVAGESSRLIYYYLWHFSAAQVSLLTGVSGWEADAGVTWFTAFSTLALMIGMARWLGGTGWSCLWVLGLAATGSLRRPLEWLFGEQNLAAVVERETGLGGWLAQSAWAPQHLASAACVILAILLAAELARRPSLICAAVLGLLAAAGFESSSWVGGVTFGVAAATVGALLLWRLPPARLLGFLGYAACAAALALVLVMPLAYAQLQLSGARAGSPVGMQFYSVLDESLPQQLRMLFNPPAFWLLFLPLEFPAFYLTGLVALVLVVRKCRLLGEPQEGVLALVALLVVSLCVTWLLTSRLGDNNDLGWRAVLPAIMLLIAFASAWLSQFSALRWGWMLAAHSMLALGLIGGLLRAQTYAFPPPSASARAFAVSPALWQAVRRHSGPAERVVNNPYYLRDLVPWAGNLSWALLSNRRSCYAAPDLVGPFATLSAERLRQFDDRFVRVFSGHPAADDLHALVTENGCNLIVVAVQDGAWVNDPFTGNPAFRLVESEPDAWRIYQALP